MKSQNRSIELLTVDPWDDGFPEGFADRFVVERRRAITASDLIASGGLIIDCRAKTVEHIADVKPLVETALANERPVVLLGVRDGGFMARLGAVGVRTTAAVLSRNRDASLTLNVRAPTRSSSSMLMTVAGDALGSVGLLEDAVSLPAEADSEDGAALRPLEGCESSTSLVDFVDRALSEIDGEPPGGVQLDNTGSLPAGQVHQTYLTHSHELPLYDSSGRRVQVATNAMVYEITLVASYAPAVTYLRILNRGAGFNPTSGEGMAADSKHNRGMFQGLIEINFKESNQSGFITTQQTSPRNANKVATYTSSSTFTAGVDVSQNPGYSASYSITESETRPVSDFNIINDSHGTAAKWQWELGTLEDGWKGLFKGGTWHKPSVRSVPLLARSNLQPDCVAVWSADNPFSGTIGMLLFARCAYYHAWVTGNELKWKRHHSVQTWEMGYYDPDAPVMIWFGAVNPDPGGER